MSRQEHNPETCEAADDRILMFQARLDGPATNPYVEAADANPERVNNGCQIYKAN